MISDGEHLFQHLFGHLYVFFGKNLYSDLPVFKIQLFGGFFVTELCEFLVCFGYKLFARHMICKYIFPFSRLPFHLVDGFTFCAEDF